MKNAEILKKAIDKAVKNGYKPAGHEIKSVEYDDGLFVFLKEGGYSGLNPTEVIFSHDFAKAFWGTTEVCKERGDIIGKDCSHYPYEVSILPEWQYHLQQMVLEKDPIKYLEKYL